MIDEGKARIGAEMSDIVTSTSSMLEARAGDFAGRLDDARHVVSRAFDADIQRLAEARAGIEQAVENHTRKLAESRDRMAAALQADLANSPKAAPRIDAAVGSQVQKLAEGRNMLSRALEEDLRKINDSAPHRRRARQPARTAVGRPREPCPQPRRKTRRNLSNPYEH